MTRGRFYNWCCTQLRDCPQSQIVLEDSFKHRLTFNEFYHWLLLTSTTTISTQILSHFPLTVESELTGAKRQENSYVLHDVYNPSDGVMTWKSPWIHFKLCVRGKIPLLKSW